LLFRKKKPAEPPPAAEPSVPSPDPQVVRTLERLQQSGAQLLVRAGGAEAYTSVVLGLGRDGFFVDTLSPPEGDRRVTPGTRVEIETLLQGITYTFGARVLGKVQFVDELPAFKLAYPEAIHGEKRRKSPRVETAGDVTLSFLRPFACDAPVVNLSEGGMAFEYDAELGRLRRGTVIAEILLELGPHPVVTVQGRVVGHVVAGLGGLTLPRRYRASVAFEGLDDRALETIRAYLATRRALDAAG